MSDYSTTITVDFTPLSALATVTQSHTLHHGTTFASFDIDGTRTTVHFAADPDDSIGSQGTVTFSFLSGDKSYNFPVSFVCNNKLNNSVTLGHSVATIVVVIQPPAEVIKTMAPVKALICISEF